jgi:Cu/Zn superoxide dismutase
MPIPDLKPLAVAVVAASFLTGPALAETMTYSADLSAAAEVPPNDSPATGTAEVTVDTDAGTVSWVVTVTDLTGDATAAHIHGPAGTDENAPPVIDMSDAIMQGSAEITEDQRAALEAGKYYVNIHTEKHPDGEIRGQLAKAQ